MHSSFLPDHLSAAPYKSIGQLLPCTIAMGPFYNDEHFVRTSWMKRRCEVITAPLAWHHSGKAFCPQIQDEINPLKVWMYAKELSNVVKGLKDIVSWRHPLSISPIRAFGHQRWWGRPNMSHCSGGYILKGFFNVGPPFGGSVRGFHPFNWNNNAACCTIFSVKTMDTMTETQQTQL